MHTATPQIKQWSETFGKEYTDRNPQTVEDMNELYQINFDVTRTALNKEFLGELNRSIKILEVGSNIGTQLLCLQEMEFSHLYGIEIQPYAVEVAKRLTKNINITNDSAFDIPYKDGYFDLVFTSGVLIHIHPNDIGVVLDEIYRCSKAYIWGYEYFNDDHRMVPYRGKENLMWKGNFVQLYLDRFADLKLVKEKRLRYAEGKNIDCMFLLKKKAS
jgi:pseudaminic acid biosynthesis-associated methylase